MKKRTWVDNGHVRWERLFCNSHIIYSLMQGLTRMHRDYKSILALQTSKKVKIELLKGFKELLKHAHCIVLQKEYRNINFQKTQSLSSTGAESHNMNGVRCSRQLLSPQHSGLSMCCAELELCIIKKRVSKIELNEQIELYEDDLFQLQSVNLFKEEHLSELDRRIAVAKHNIDKMGTTGRPDIPKSPSKIMGTLKKLFK